MDPNVAMCLFVGLWMVGAAAICVGISVGAARLGRRRMR